MLLALASACSDGDDSGSSTRSASTTRSPACKAMQDASCDRLADRCKEAPRAECDDTFQSFFCKSDATATACAKALETASCGGTPPECQGIADTVPAIQLCNEFLDLFCEALASCGKVSKSDCRQQVAGSIPCSEAVGILPSYDTCKVDLPEQSCDASGNIALPESCKGVVKVNTAAAPTSAPPGLGWQTSTAVSPGGLLPR
jgi:hypothetical protein